MVVLLRYSSYLKTGVFALILAARSISAFHFDNLLRVSTLASYSRSRISSTNAQCFPQRFHRKSLSEQRMKKPNQSSEDPFSESDNDVSRLRSERDKVLAELDLDREMNVRGEIGAREKVLLCALNTLEENVGSVYGPNSPQSERVQALKDAFLERNDQWTLLKTSEPDFESSQAMLNSDLRSSKEKLMAELDCDCQLSRNVVGARERVLMSALRALEEGLDEMYGPGSKITERLRDVQAEVLDGREWSLLQVSERDTEAVRELSFQLAPDDKEPVQQQKSMWQLSLEREQILAELSGALPCVGGQMNAREAALRAALTRVEAAMCDVEGP